MHSAPRRSRKRVVPITQSAASDCGLACLAMLACYHGRHLRMADLHQRFSSSLNGVDLARLLEMAQRLDFDARALRVEPEHLASLQLPCILHWDLNHFVVLDRVVRSGVAIVDPGSGEQQVGWDELGRRFSGVVLELKPSVSFTPRRQPRRLSLRELAGSIQGLGGVVAQILGLALAIEVIALLLPLQMQWVLDQVLVSGDQQLLLLTAVGFSTLVVLQTGLSVGRAWLLSWLGASVNAQWAVQLFGHLLSLPLPYFERRSMGDIVSRFSSLRTIQATLTGGFVGAVLDGLMGLFALLMLAYYDRLLAAVSVVVLLLYTVTRLSVHGRMRRVNEQAVESAARQQTELMESVRGIQAIKLANRQAQRKARLADVTQVAAERGMRAQQWLMLLGAVTHGLGGLQRAALIALSAYMTLAAHFTAGMLVACVVYADQFGSKFSSLVDRLMELRLLGLHAERIADIALEPVELLHTRTTAARAQAPRVVLRDVGFRYGEGEPWVFRHVNLVLEPGECVALIGPSGCGKSTLAKLILGLLPPVEGVIEINGIDLRRYGTGNLREISGAVMQDDHLFAGSIGDNIAFFEPGATPEAIQAAACAAAIHADIAAMPMGYDSLVGDMGSTLSGGQKQRVLLARALYRRPRLLVLDEATSHLDRFRESDVNANVSRLRCTRLVIAHRQETIASADRVLSLRDACRAAPPTAVSTEIGRA